MKVMASPITFQLTDKLKFTENKSWKKEIFQYIPSKTHSLQTYKLSYRSNSNSNKLTKWSA